MTVRPTIVGRRFVALATCALLVTAMPIPALAEYGIGAGAPAVATAGAPVLVRVAPGWDAAVAYELADGASVTVWDVAQSAPDGSLWYPIDGGYVPAESVTSVATLEGQVLEPQAVATMATDSVEPATEETWTEPAVTEGTGWVDPQTGEWVAAVTAEAAWIDPAAPVDAIEPASGESEQLAAPAGEVEPATGEWIDPAAPAEGVEPVVEAWIDPAAPVGSVDLVAEGWTNAAEPVAGADPASEAWVDPAAPAEAVSGEWEQPVEVAQEAVVDEAIESGASYVELEQRGRNRDNDKNDGKDKDKEKRGGNDGDGNAGSSTGRQIADFALKYEGYPYVYAGEGPNAFDCSGFTMFVIRKTLGIDITHDMFTQYDMGQEVGRNELQPGDLVFFKNTFRRGMSHNGIYIGGGQFVHAENESTGVVISDLDSDYYGERWYGAVRFE